jgi:hypothetical protein
MGETLLLLSCGAAFITGLVIAAGKPIRLAWPWALPRSFRRGRGRSPKKSPPTDSVQSLFAIYECTPLVQ